MSASVMPNVFANDLAPSGHVFKSSLKFACARAEVDLCHLRGSPSSRHKNSAHRFLLWHNPTEAFATSRLWSLDLLHENSLELLAGLPFVVLESLDNLQTCYQDITHLTWTSVCEEIEPMSKAVRRLKEILSSLTDVYNRDSLIDRARDNLADAVHISQVLYVRDPLEIRTGDRDCRQFPDLDSVLWIEGLATDNIASDASKILEQINTFKEALARDCTYRLRPSLRRLCESTLSCYERARFALDFVFPYFKREGIKNNSDNGDDDDDDEYYDDWTDDDLRDWSLQSTKDRMTDAAFDRLVVIKQDSNLLGKMFFSALKAF